MDKSEHAHTADRQPGSGTEPAHLARQSFTAFVSRCCGAGLPRHRSGTRVSCTNDRRCARRAGVMGRLDVPWGSARRGLHKLIQRGRILTIRQVPFRPGRAHSQGPFMAVVPRRATRKVIVGDQAHGFVGIGGDAPVALQTMTSTYTYDIDATVAQINRLHAGGADLVRVAVPDKRDTQALKEILNQVRVPIIADVHFHFERALEAIEAGVHKIRLNPGNIKDRPKVEKVIAACKERQIPIRVGANEGGIVEAAGQGRAGRGEGRPRAGLPRADDRDHGREAGGIPPHLRRQRLPRRRALGQERRPRDRAVRVHRDQQAVRLPPAPRRHPRRPARRPAASARSSPSAPCSPRASATRSASATRPTRSTRSTTARNSSRCSASASAPSRS